MADSASESDSSSVDGGPIMMPPSPVTREQLQKRIESLTQANKVLKVELDTYKLRVKSLHEENKALKRASVSIQAKAEQEEEFISNTLLKKIQALKKEKETLALNYEQEEECLTNDLSRKLVQLRQEKVELEHSLEREQESIVNKLMRKIQKLEAETSAKQSHLDTLRREKVELENTLEQEQEALVNRLWKRMDKLETEKRMLQGKLEQPVCDNKVETVPPRDSPEALTSHIGLLRSQVDGLKHQLSIAEQQHQENMAKFAHEEKQVREENQRLQRRLQLEMDRREALCRHLSESESSLEMDEDRSFASDGAFPPHSSNNRTRTLSSPLPRPISPGGSKELLSPGSPMSTGRCNSCGQMLPTLGTSPTPPAVVMGQQNKSGRFVKPSPPAMSPGSQPQPMDS